jgi:hypothetical protein
MALHGSASPNLAPILFKGNNRSFAINLLIHQDQSGSMSPFTEFYRTGSFIGTLQDALLAEKIGIDTTRYPNLYGYFTYNSRNPRNSFNISNREGTLTISQAFIKGESTGAATTTSWYGTNGTNGYFANTSSHVVNICTNVAGTTTGGRLGTQSADNYTEDVHGNLWSIFTSPNAISTGTPGTFGSILNSNIRKNTTTVILTNSDEQSGGPAPMIGPVGTLQPNTYVPVVVGNYNFSVVNTNFLQNGRTGMTQVFSGSSDNNNYSITSPFPINFLGPTNSLGDTYTSVFFGTNGYFTFGSGSNVSTGLASPTVPNRPAIKVFASDKTLNWLGHRTIGTAPNRTWIVRYEGVNPITTNVSISNVSFVENGRTGMTAISIPTPDNNFYQITSPFSINFLQTNYSSVYFGTNGYFTFGGGSNDSTGLASPTVPNRPAIKVFASDKTISWLGQRTIGTTPNRTWIVRYEGVNPITTNISISNVSFVENGRTGMTEIASGGIDDDFYSASSPFSINFLQTNYNEVFISTNGYFTFGSGSGAYQDISDPLIPSLPGIKVFANDLQLDWAGYRVIGTAPNRTFIIRFEGQLLSSGLDGSEIYEARFYEGQNYYDVYYVTNYFTGTAGLQNGTSPSYLLTWSPTENTTAPYTTSQGYRITQSTTNPGSEIYEARFYENMGDIDYIDLHYVANSNTGTAGLQNGTSASYLSTWTPSQNINSPYTTGEAFRISVANSRTINGLLGEMLFREYRIVALSSYTSTDGYDGVLFYGNSFEQPYGYVLFTGATTFTITRSSTAPNWTSATNQLQNTLLLASQTRGALFKIANVYNGGTTPILDRRTAFANCLTEFLASTI